MRSVDEINENIRVITAINDSTLRITCISDSFKTDKIELLLDSGADMNIIRI